MEISDSDKINNNHDIYSNSNLYINRSSRESFCADKEMMGGSNSTSSKRKLSEDKKAIDSFIEEL